METVYLLIESIYLPQHRNLDFIFVQISILNSDKVSWCDNHNCDWIVVVWFCFPKRLHHCLFKTSLEQAKPMLKMVSVLDWCHALYLQSWFAPTPAALPFWFTWVSCIPSPASSSFSRGPVSPPLGWHIKNDLKGTSLVAQWLRIHLPVQGTWIRALVWEDPTCLRATKPVCHNYWACALEPTSHNYWSPRSA